MSINVYEQNRILAASQIELVQILYDAAANSVRDAVYHLQGGDIAARSRAITKTQMIILELATSLDRTQHQAFPERLAALYDCMLVRLTEANLTQTAEPLAEVGRLLCTLKEGWAAAAVSEELEPALAAR